MDVTAYGRQEAWEDLPLATSVSVAEGTLYRP